MTDRRYPIPRHLVWLLVTLMALTGCRMPGVAPSTGAPTLGVSIPEAVPALAGRVLFVEERRTQASMTDVAVAATVSLINTGTNQTVATTLTNAAGQFVLSFGKDFQPDPSAVYYLEAIKGLDNNRPSSNVARVRTLARFQSSAWTTLTAGSILISRSTTALAIGAALKQGTATPVDFSALIGKLAPGATSELDVYTPIANLSGADFTALLNLVTTNLTANRDPVATLGYNAGTSTFTNLGSGGSSGFSVTSATPATGGAGTSVTLAGTGFSTTLASNSVSFAGTPATVTAATATSLTTTVPTGATSGQVVVTVDGTSALGPLFSVPVTVTGFTPTSGTAGTTVTVTGTGFSATAGDNLVLVNGALATATAATATSLTFTMPGASTGKITVNVKGSSGTSAGDFTYGGPFLSALNPPLAVTGAKLTLEGSFGTSATVNFPGGSAIAATVLGRNRAEVTVPAGATAGSLTVTTGGVTTNALPFRRSSFALGLQNFQAQYDQADVAHMTPSLVTARYGHTSEVIGNYLYVIGGYGGSATIGSVERALIHADGTLGAFSTVGSLQATRYTHTSHVIGNYLYVIGGYGTAYLASVERATINPDGSIGPFATVAGVSLVAARRSHVSAVIGHYLYVFGGSATPNPETVERAVINPDGTIGTFTTVAGVTLTTIRSEFAGAVIGNYMYLFGGSGTSGVLSTIERAPINPDGSLGTFAAIAGTLTVPRTDHSAIAYGGKVYLLGGYNTTGLASIEQATINSDGSLGAFSTSATSLTRARFYHSVSIVGNYLYAIGGGPGTLASIERASLNGGGTLGTFATVSGIALSTTQSRMACVATSRYLYVLGGYDGGGSAVKAIERAPINPDGTLGTFAPVAGAQLNINRADPTEVVIGDYVYLIGGYDGAVSLNSIERAVIHPDGTLGPFAIVSGLTLGTGRNGARAVVLGNKLYVLGGWTGGYTNSIEQATIDANYNLGSFSAAPAYNVSLSTPTMAALGSTLYAVGGMNGTIQSAVRVTGFGADGSLSGWSTSGTIALATVRYDHVSALLGNSLYVFGGSGDGVAIQRATLDGANVLSTFSTVAGQTLAVAHSGGGAMVLGNYVHVLGAAATIDRAVLQ